MATFGALKAKITDDLLVGAAVGQAQIADAVLAAIDAYEARRFWFNESRTVAFNTIIGEFRLRGPDMWGRIITADWLTTTVDCDEHPMYYQTPSQVDYLLHKTHGATNAQPYIWTTYGGVLRVYPRPNIIYPIRVNGLITWPTLVNDQGRERLDQRRLRADPRAGQMGPGAERHQGRCGGRENGHGRGAGARPPDDRDRAPLGARLRGSSLFLDGPVCR